MEQRIGSSSKPVEGEPVTGAGFDPAFIPGITGPAAKSQPEPEPESESEPTAPEPAEEPEPKAETQTAEAPAEPEEEKEAPEDGPVFEASDRRAKFVADHRGVRLSLDEENCEFRWNEIAAVETESPRFGKRFTITVHTPDRRWYPIEIEATARARFKEWEDELDAVLDAYFEEA
ncbi:hypothetical protein [Streptomyces sp. Ag109_G2-15]|uniref:hypothetical protein n=1 Tax=Streptomyces sp. Ag109_G2-15 TaxID=1938850 RepID=UPI000BE490D1|nr:hypothetical protein [Streptomyces sp. Ag109_G2-15]